MSTSDKYEHAIEECDILDTQKGQAFRSKRGQWIESLGGKDPHAILKQIHSMLWDYALFCTINELRRLAGEKSDKKVGFNGPVIRLFDAGFVTTQAVAIRRLIEKPKSNPKLAIISLRTILKDMEANLSLITRENFVCYDGTPYDGAAVEQHWLSNLVKEPDGVQSRWMPTDGQGAWHVSKLRHKNFDRLAQVSCQDRRRTDLIKTDIFRFLESQLVKCEDVKKYVDKFIAHAATPATRASLSEGQTAITLDRLKACHKIIYEVAYFIFGPLLWESNLGGLPVPQYDHLMNLEKAWATAGNLQKARQKWDEYARDVSEWDSTSIWPQAFKEY